MSDIADRADPACEQLVADGLSAHRARVAAEAALPVNKSGLCVDCDEAIEQERLTHYPRAQRCVGCQEIHELRERR